MTLALRSCDVHPGGRRAITRGSMTYGAEAGAHQLVETGEHDVQNRQVHHRRRLRLAGWLAGRIALAASGTGVSWLAGRFAGRAQFASRLARTSTAAGPATTR